MKLVGTVVEAVVLVFCLVVMAYADSSGDDDKTELAKATALAEAKAQLQPIATDVKNTFDSVLKDRKLEYTEMNTLRTAVNDYQEKLTAANKHLAVYKVTLVPEAYPPAVKLTELYFMPFFLSDGHFYQNEMRLLAAKEGVDIQEIERDFPVFSMFVMLISCLVGVVFVSQACDDRDWGLAFLALVFFALTIVVFLV